MERMRILNVHLLWLILGVVTGGSLFAATTYTVTVIPLPAGWTLTSINNAGQVAGFGYNGSTDVPFIGTASGITPIPLPPGWSHAKVFGINDSGQVAGWGWKDFVYNYRAFIGTASGITPIPLPPGWIYSAAFGINNSGQVAGWGWRSCSGCSPVPFIGTASGFTPIELPPGWRLDFAQLSKVPGGINNFGQVGSWGEITLDFLVVPFIATTSGITRIPLPPGWILDEVFGINDSGQVGGTVFDGSTVVPFIGTASGITPIPVPPEWSGGNWLKGGGINNSGQVVGLGRDFPFVGTAGGITSLNNLVPVGWYITRAIAINNKGQIAAEGVGPDGIYRALILDPIQTGLSAPTNLRVTQIGNNGTQIRLTWDYGSDPVDGFKLEYMRLSGFSDHLFTGPNDCTSTSPGLSCTFVVGGLPQYATYKYRVLAYKAGVESDYSSPAIGFQLSINGERCTETFGVITCSALVPLLSAQSTSNNSIKAIFSPDPGVTLGQAAQFFGYDHFNWISVINHDDTSTVWCSSSQCPLPPPYLDPPQGGYTQPSFQPFDGLPYYWNEEAGYDNRYFVSSNETLNSSSFYDHPWDTGRSPGGYIGGSVAKTAEQPNGAGGLASVNYSVLRPRMSWMTRTSPSTSPFGNQLTWPFRIMCTTS